MNILADLIHAKRTHVGPLESVADLAWKLAGRRVPHCPHTIWQQVGHLDFWMDFGLRSIEGAEPKPPAHAVDSWPQADGPTDELSWKHEIALLTTNLGQLTTLANARASTLSRIVDPKRGLTVEGVIWQLVAHNSYHTGQIVQLRQALAAWPPPGGGSTW